MRSITPRSIDPRVMQYLNKRRLSEDLPEGSPMMARAMLDAGGGAPIRGGAPGGIGGSSYVGMGGSAGGSTGFKEELPEPPPATHPRYLKLADPESMATPQEQQMAQAKPAPQQAPSPMPQMQQRPPTPPPPEYKPQDMPYEHDPMDEYLMAENRGEYDDSKSRVNRFGNPGYKSSYFAERTRDITPNFVAAFGKSGAQLGTLNGKVADTSALYDYAKASNERDQDRIKAAGDFEAGEDKALQNRQKILQYLNKKRDDQKAYGMEKGKANESARHNRATEHQARQQLDANNMNAVENERHSKATEGQAKDRLDFDKQNTEANRQSNQTIANIRAGSAGRDKVADRRRDEAVERYINLQNNAQKLRDLVTTYGTVSAFGTGGTDMDRTIYEMAIDYAKLVDPESVAREGEVKAAQKYMMDFRNWAGWTTSNDTAKDQIDHYMMTLDERMRSKGFNPEELKMQTYDPKEYNIRTPNNATRSPELERKGAYEKTPPVEQPKMEPPRVTRPPEIPTPMDEEGKAFERNGEVYRWQNGKLYKYVDE